MSRGFRGIGRLGGLGYCDELSFTTKARGERTTSTSVWDCKKLRDIISGKDKTIDAREIVQKVTVFTQTKYDGNINDHYFIVEMKNVRSSKSLLLNVPLIKKYLAQVAPVPFALNGFSYFQEIERTIKEKTGSYKTYSIFVNGDQVFKPYLDRIQISKGLADQISGIEIKELAHENETLAIGWVANLKLLGAINPSYGIEGIRVRSGNILVGDRSILSNYYKESRFSNYLVGELYIASEKLVLNGRRDDFEDNKYKELFYSIFLKEIGLPYSLKIRSISELRSEHNKQCKLQYLQTTANRIVKKGHLSEAHRTKVASDISYYIKNSDEEISSKLKELLPKVENSRHLLSINYSHIPTGVKSLLSKMFDTIYKNITDKNEAERAINSIIKIVGNNHQASAQYKKLGGIVLESRLSRNVFAR
jgi:molecular chaperone HtpG